MTLRTTTIRPKICKVCKCKFQPRISLATVCGVPCAQSLAVSIRAKAAKVAAVQDKRETKAKLDALRKKPQLVVLAQKAFNSFIRARDAGKPCICCGKPLTAGAIGGGYDAGHYRSVGSAPNLRFDETNCHAQSKHCNQYLAGNHVAYRQGLIKRIGLRMVELIEADQTVRRYTHEGLVEIARYYNAEARRLKVAI